MKKKFVSALLAGAMVLSLLAGCGQQEEQAASDDKVSSEKTEQSEEKESSESSEAAPEEEGPMVISLVAASQSNNGDFEEMVLFNKIEELFNVEFEIEMIDSGAWGEKAPLMFASGELPDFFCNIANGSEYGEQGFLIDLLPYLTDKEKMPNFNAMAEEVPAVWNAFMESDGSAAYTVVGVNARTREQCANRFYINTGWAEEILGKQPETLDEFYQYLVGVKENDMNGNGDPNDEIPLSGNYFSPASDATDLHIFYPILAAFGYTGTVLDVRDDKAIYIPNDDLYKEFLIYMNKLYTEGLLDQEYFTHTDEQAAAKQANMQVGAYCNWASFINLPEAEQYEQYDGLDPMTSEWNDTQVWAAFDVRTAGAFCITTSCEQEKVDKLIEILDWCYGFEGSRYVSFGLHEVGENEKYPEAGAEVEILDDGAVVEYTWNYPSDEYATYDDYLNYSVFPHTCFFPVYMNFEAKETGYSLTNYLTDNILNHYAPYYKVGWPSNTIKYTTEESDELTLLNADINSYVEEMVVKMIIGEIDIEDGFEEYREGLKDRGIERKMEIHQAAYDRWLELQQ